MADNVTIDPGTTPSIVVATDDGGAGGHVQLFKMAYSANGSVTLVTADASGLMVQVGAALPAGTNAIGKLAANSGVDIGDVDVTTVGTITPGTAASSLGKAEDAVAGSGDVGVMSLAVRADSLAATAANGDYHPFLVDGNGAQWTTVSGLFPGSGASQLGKAEDAAHTSGDVGVMALTVRQDSLAALAGTDGDYQPFSTDSNNRLRTNAALTVATTGGCTINRLISAATTNATSVKGSAGAVYGWYLSNANASVRFFKLYNKATAPTVGSDTPVMTIPIPGNGATNIAFPQGIVFGTGIGFAITTGIADADTGAVSANEHALNLLYA